MEADSLKKEEMSSRNWLRATGATMTGVVEQFANRRGGGTIVVSPMREGANCVVVVMSGVVEDHPAKIQGKHLEKCLWAKPNIGISVPMTTGKFFVKPDLAEELFGSFEDQMISALPTYEILQSRMSATGEPRNSIGSCSGLFDEGVMTESEDAVVQADTSEVITLLTAEAIAINALKVAEERRNAVVDAEATFHEELWEDLGEEE